MDWFLDTVLGIAEIAGLALLPLDLARIVTQISEGKDPVYDFFRELNKVEDLLIKELIFQGKVLGKFAYTAFNSAIAAGHQVGYTMGTIVDVVSILYGSFKLGAQAIKSGPKLLAMLNDLPSFIKALEIAIKDFGNSLVKSIAENKNASFTGLIAKLDLIELDKALEIFTLIKKGVSVPVDDVIRITNSVFGDLGKFDQRELDNAIDIVTRLNVEYSVDEFKTLFAKISGETKLYSPKVIENALAFAKENKAINLADDAEWLGRISGDLSNLSNSTHFNAAKLIASKGVNVNADELSVLLSKVSGDLNQLNKYEIAAALKDARLVNLNIPEYLAFKAARGNATVEAYQFNKGLSADRVKYDLLDIDHTILGDFNPDGTFKGGSHFYEIMEEYIKQGLLEASLNSSGTQRITSLSQAPKNEHGVVRLFVREYKGNRAPIWQPKTISPSNMSAKEYLDLGNKFLTESVLVDAETSRYQMILSNGQIIEGYINDKVVRTWYFKY